MINKTLAKMFINEHNARPITRVLCLGRQTIALDYNEAVLFMNGQKRIDVPVIYDTETSAYRKLGKSFLSDKTFFGMLGIEVVSLDLNDYEGADIIHNLNYPIPSGLVGQFDYIIDGGTLDHLFNIMTAFENIVNLLSPGGRIFQWNAAANYAGTAYVSFGPDLFYDFYTQNGFACTVYLAENKKFTDDKWHVYKYHGGRYSNLCSRKEQVLIVMAEKSAGASFDKIPTQWCYNKPTIKSLVKPESLRSLFFKRLKDRGIFYCLYMAAYTVLLKIARARKVKRVLTSIRNIFLPRKIYGFTYLGKM